MVSSNGTRYTANAWQNPDLFFALRGGGGGTYGVVTSVTYQTHPNLPLIAAVLAVSTDSPTPSAPLRSLFSTLVAMHPNLSDAGWGGSAALTAGAGTGDLVLSAMYVLVNGTSATANASIGPLFEQARALAGASRRGESLTVQEAFTTPVDSFFTWYNTFFPDIADSGTSGALGSWLIPRDVLQKDPTHVAQTILPFTELTVV